MSHNPDAGVVAPNVVEEVIGKTVEVAAPQSTGVEMEKARILRHLQKSRLELRKEVLRQGFCDLPVLF